MNTKAFIEVLIIILSVVACTPATPITTATEDVSTATFVVSNTSTATFLPTQTFTPPATLTPFPTYTPATPVETSKLRFWSGNDADLLIAQISSNLDALEYEPVYQTVYGWDSYLQQYRYLAFAEEEALLRFPNAPQAEKWRWDHCYNLALSYPYAESADAPELSCYAQLIENGLNSGETTLTDLPTWFTSHERRFSFSITSHASPQGFTSAYVIALENNAFLWLLEQS